jgi:ubiquinone/menaquinone biosynthesis methyltransferase
MPNAPSTASNAELNSPEAQQPAPTLVPQITERDAGVAQSHASAVRLMFDRISPTYDLLNRLMSLGIDRSWRRQALDTLARDLPDGVLVDVCAGTLDLSAAMRRRWPGRPLLSLDFARDMLVAGRHKAPTAGCVVADAMRLPLATGSIAGYICGFGVRNLSDPKVGLCEASRVLEPGGICVVLEFFRPEKLSTRVFHAFYGRLLLPMVGRMVSGDTEAYTYLSRSMRGFLSRKEYTRAMVDAGFERVESTDLLWGIASIVRGVRAELLPGEHA